MFNREEKLHVLLFLVVCWIFSLLRSSFFVLRFQFVVFIFFSTMFVSIFIFLCCCLLSILFDARVFFPRLISQIYERNSFVDRVGFFFLNPCLSNSTIVLLAKEKEREKKKEFHLELKQPGYFYFSAQYRFETRTKRPRKGGKEYIFSFVG